MNEYTAIEADAKTGQVIERPFTAEEITQKEADLAAMQASQEIADAKAAADAVIRNAAIEHAKSLGFTDAMIAVMYPNLLGSGDATE
jgi:hypothetical protein